MDYESTDLDVPFLAAYWAHTARTLISRIRDYESLLTGASAGTHPLTVADSWQWTADSHFALLSIAHVVKACDLAADLPRFPDAELLVLLRNFAEHWEEPNGRSGRALARVRLDKMTNGIIFIDEWDYLSGVDSIDSRDLDDWLVDVERAARSLATCQDDPLPNVTQPLR